MVCPIFTSWDEDKHWEGEANRERNLRNAMIISYPFSRIQLCTRMGLLTNGLVVHMLTDTLQNDHTKTSRLQTDLTVVQRTSLDKIPVGWSGKDAWRDGRVGFPIRSALMGAPLNPFKGS